MGERWKSRFVLHGLLPLLVFGALTAVAAAADFPVIEAAELKAKLDAGEPVFLLNPLSNLEFNEQHIPGSVNIPLGEIETTDRLPADKGRLLVTYCLGPK